MAPHGRLTSPETALHTIWVAQVGLECAKTTQINPLVPHDRNIQVKGSCCLVTQDWLSITIYVYYARAPKGFAWATMPLHIRALKELIWAPKGSCRRDLRAS